MIVVSLTNYNVNCNEVHKDCFFVFLSLEDFDCDYFVDVARGHDEDHSLIHSLLVSCDSTHQSTKQERQKEDIVCCC